MPDRAAVERQALADELRRLREDYESRLSVMENAIAMQQTSILQLQNLFAERTVERDSGATDGN